MNTKKTRKSSEPVSDLSWLLPRGPHHGYARDRQLIAGGRLRGPGPVRRGLPKGNPVTNPYGIR